MKNYMVDINEITIKRPTTEEAKIKYNKYMLKAELGLLTNYDESSNMLEKDLLKIGFKSLADYEITKLDVIQMIDENIPIQKELIQKLKQAKALFE